ncbi:TPA: hypothetical protein N0F65_004949 [Lagenidium giganteum]|uniref:Uncharacterized protein n=1 Tax=Lagenidium giganteum TaxID=4803 RepID=A0AAV2YU20_9STRA|nr:TPA: hypothetical protein N0F65_004949 [Lagenidium giganteum]
MDNNNNNNNNQQSKLPPARLRFTLKEVVRQKCEKCTKPVIADHAPYLCHIHCKNPDNGWCYLTRMEVTAINLMRDLDCVEEAIAYLNELKMKQELQAMMGSMQIDNEPEPTNQRRDRRVTEYAGWSMCT